MPFPDPRPPAVGTGPGPSGTPSPGTPSPAADVVRHPWQVPDPDPPLPEHLAAPDGLSVRDGADSDHDGLADTVLTDDGVDLLVHTDLDGDGLADRVLRVGPDGGPGPTPAPADPGGDRHWLLELLSRLFR